MEIEKSRVFSAPAVEFSASSDFGIRNPKRTEKTRNKSPTKATGRKSLSPPKEMAKSKEMMKVTLLPRVSEVLAKIPTPAFEVQSKQINSVDWKAELDGLELEFYDDQLGLCFIPDDAPEGSIGSIEISDVLPYCDICGSKYHYPSGCGYLSEIPRGEKLVNDSKYLIVCACGEEIVDDCCHSGYCVSLRPRHVIFKASLSDRYCTWQGSSQGSSKV